MVIVLIEFFKHYFGLDLVANVSQIRTRLVSNLEILRSLKIFTIFLIVYEHQRIAEREHHSKVRQTGIVSHAIHYSSFFVVINNLSRLLISYSLLQDAGFGYNSLFRR